MLHPESHEHLLHLFTILVIHQHVTTFMQNTVLMFKNGVSLCLKGLRTGSLRHNELVQLEVLRRAVCGYGVGEANLNGYAEVEGE